MARRQTKTMPQQWATARALYEADKSLRDIEKATGLDHSNLAKKAKSENWQRGILPQLISDTVRVMEKLTTLNLPQQQVVNDEVDERTKYLQYFKNANLLHSNIALKKLKRDGVKISYAELNSSINVVSKAQDGVLGKQPDTAFQVNNNIDTGVTELLKRAMGTALRPPK